MQLQWLKMFCSLVHILKRGYLTSAELQPLCVIYGIMLNVNVRVETAEDP